MGVEKGGLEVRGKRELSEGSSTVTNYGRMTSLGKCLRRARGFADGCVLTCNLRMNVVLISLP